MTSYRYHSNSLIDQVTFVRGDDGADRAYLHAQSLDGMDTNAIEHQLKLAGFQAIPAEHAGKPALEVRGFWQDQQLLNELQKNNLTQGKPTIDKSQDKKMGWIDWVRSKSLFLSGVAYIVGDIKFISYGRKGKSVLNQTAGYLYGSGTAANLLLGRKSSADLKVHDLAQQMADFVNEQKFQLPDHTAIKHILDDKHKSFFEKTDDYLRHFPSEAMNLFFAMSGVCIAAAAYKSANKSGLPAGMIDQYVNKRVSVMQKAFPHTTPNPSDIAAIRAKAEPMLHKFHSTAKWMDVGLGSMTFASGMFGALVQEKKHDPDVPRKEGLAGVWEWMQERPLTITGIGLMVSTMCHAASTGIEYRIGTTDAKKAIFDRGVFVATNLLAEFLIAISSKGHGQGVKTDGSIDDSIINIAAELIARNPKEQHPEMIKQLSIFLGKPEALAIDNKEAEEKLNKALLVMEKNPWSQPLAPESSKASWQSKMTAAQAVPMQLGA